MNQTPRLLAADLRAILDQSDTYNGVLDRLSTAIEMGEGYVVLTLDPDGLKITPLVTQNVDQTIVLRSKARRLARLTWELGNGRFVATARDGEEDLPTSLIPVDPTPTYSTDEPF